MTTIVLSAGGTGGHLFPAQALAGELVRRGKEIVVMTDSRGHSYADAFPSARIEIVPSAAFSDRSLLGLVSAPFEIFAGIVMSLVKLARIRPKAVIGFGGYPSVPVMVAACLSRLPTAILAPDAVLGRANRLVANFVHAIAANFPLVRFAPRDMSKVVYTGNPLRPEVIALAGAPYDTPKAGDPLRLLVFGGSQGARVFRERVPPAIELLPAAVESQLAIVQQCRPEDVDAVRAVYAKMGVNAVLAPFFRDLPERMAWAHLVIARSGAGTVSELAAIVVPRSWCLCPMRSTTTRRRMRMLWPMSAAAGAWRRKTLRRKSSPA